MAPATRASRARGTFAGGVSANAFVRRALCDKRNFGCDSGDSGALFLFASAEERQTERIAICVARTGHRCCNANESDWNSITANRNRGNCRQTRLRASTNRYLVAQSRAAARDLFCRVRLALYAHLAEVRHAAARELGCDKRVHVVAGSRLSHRG